MADIIIQNISESDYSAILRQAVALLPWGHTLKLMQKFGNELPYRTKLPLLDSELNNED